MERRMKAGYLDQQVPYTFSSVSAAPASNPAPPRTQPLLSPQSPSLRSQRSPGLPRP